jgi:hypothetical protein
VHERHADGFGLVAQLPVCALALFPISASFGSSEARNALLGHRSAPPYS